MLLLTLRGTPTLYYGDEIGLRQVAIAPEQVRDPFEKNVPGLGSAATAAARRCNGRRQPMPGFSTAPPWLPLADDFMHENVANLDADPQSILSLYKALIRLRQERPPLVIGSYEPIAAHDDLLIYRRRCEGASLTEVLNLGPDPVSLGSDAIELEGEILLSTFMDRAGEAISGAVDLRGNEGVITGASVRD